MLNSLHTLCRSILYVFWLFKLCYTAVRNELPSVWNEEQMTVATCKWCNWISSMMTVAIECDDCCSCGTGTCGWDCQVCARTESASCLMYRVPTTLGHKASTWTPSSRNSTLRNTLSTQYLTSSWKMWTGYYFIYQLLQSHLSVHLSPHNHFEMWCVWSCTPDIPLVDHLLVGHKYHS